MERKKPDIIYSEPVRDIMGSPPASILRYGTTALFVIFIVIIVFAAVFRYPDIVKCPVELTTENPPVTLNSKGSFRIRKLYVNEGDTVKADALLGVMETVASVEEIKALETFIDTCRNVLSLKEQSIPQFSRLGELQVHYGSYRKSYTDLSNFIRNDYYGNRINSVKNEIEGLKKYISELSQKEKLMKQNLDLEESQYERDSKLRSSNVLADAELERSKKNLNTQKIDHENVRLELASKTIDLANRQQQVIELSVTRDEERGKLTALVEEAFSNLGAELKLWENRYLLVAQTGGVVTFTKYWKENQLVNENEAVVTVVPLRQGDYVGRINLGMQSSGKVDTGQLVNIKLSGFPYLEYGMIRGKVRSKSLVPSGDSYVIEIRLNDGFKSLYGKKLKFTQNMTGTAEIITNDRSLLARIFTPFRHLVTGNRR